MMAVDNARDAIPSSIRPGSRIVPHGQLTGHLGANLVRVAAVESSLHRCMNMYVLVGRQGVPHEK